MAEESDLSRTEPASPRRLQQARNQGDVPRSAELTAWVVLLSALAGLTWLAPQIFTSLSLNLQTALQSAAQPFPAQPFDTLLTVGGVMLPLLGLIFVALLVAPMLLSGWVFAPRALSFNVQRLNPFAAVQRLFSIEAVYLVVKTLIKFVLVGAICWMTLAGELEQLFALPGGAPGHAFAEASSLLMKGLFAVVGMLALIALIDSGWHWWRYRARHAMTWQEVLAEAKESEGSPEMRGRMLGRQRAAAAQSSANPLPGGEGTNVMPKAVDE